MPSNEEMIALIKGAAKEDQLDKMSIEELESIYNYGSALSHDRPYDEELIKAENQFKAEIERRKVTKQLDSVYETPLVILRLNRKRISLGIGVLGLCLFYFIFGVILPVLMTGDYNSAWPPNTGTYAKNFAIFYLSWISLPFLLFILVLGIRDAGTYYFYNDRVELHTYFIKRKIMIPYNRMHVVRLSGAIIMTAQSLPGRSHPLQRFKERYWNSMGFHPIFNFKDPKVAGMKTGLQGTWENPEDGQKALQILKERAFSFVEE
jgi:hypothetical protein